MKSFRQLATIALLALISLAAPSDAQQTVSGAVLRPGTTPLSALSQSGATDQQVAQWSAANGRWQPGNMNPGTVTSVGLSLPSIFSVTGSPITGSGTFTVSLASQSAYTFLGVGAGGGAPAFISIPAAAIPNLPASIITSGQLGVAQGGTGQGSYSDGQLLIGDGSTGGLDKAALTAGSGVTITSGHGSITISASGGGGGSPTVNAAFGAGGPYSLTTAYANTGIAPITLTGGNTYQLNYICNVSGLSSSANPRAVLYDSTNGGYIPFSEQRFAEAASGSNVTQTTITGSCIYTPAGSGNVTVQAWAANGNSAAGQVNTWLSRITAIPVSSSSAQTQQANTFPTGPGTPVSHYIFPNLTGSQGSTISSITDNGSAGITLNSGAIAPTLAVTAWNGLNAAQFVSGSTLGMSSTSIPTTSSSFDIFLVMQAPTVSTSRLIFSVGTNGTNGVQIACPATGEVADGLSGTIQTTSSVQLPSNGWIIVEVQRTSGGTLSLYVNNVLQGTSTASFTAPTGNFQIGGAAGMQIGEEVEWSSALSSTNQAAVYNYLASRWAN